MFTRLASVAVLAVFASVVSADAQWTGPGYDTQEAWETTTNWSTFPVATDLIVKAYRSDEGGSNITIGTSVSGGVKLQMKYGKSKITINNGGVLTNSGVVEMFMGTSSEVEIKTGGRWDACTISGTTFNLSTSTASKDTVSVWGALNVSGSSDPRLTIGTTTNASGQGTLNIYGGGVVSVDDYTIGSHGIIKMWAGGVLKIKDNVTTQTSADIAPGGKIQGQGVTLTTYYNAGENMTYVTPEPATLALLGLGCLALLRNRK